MTRMNNSYEGNFHHSLFITHHYVGSKPPYAEVEGSSRDTYRNSNRPENL